MLSSFIVCKTEHSLTLKRQNKTLSNCTFLCLQQLAVLWMFYFLFLSFFFCMFLIHTIWFWYVSTAQRREAHKKMMFWRRRCKNKKQQKLNKCKRWTSLRETYWFKINLIRRFPTEVYKNILFTWLKDIKCNTWK
jgi:hypothetical protein